MTILLPSRQLIQPGRQFELNTNCWEADGLVGWWPLGSYPDCRDMSLHGNHGTPVGGPVQAASGERFGLEFDGVDDYVDVPTVSFSATSDVTISVWFNTFDNNYSNGQSVVALEESVGYFRIDLYSGQIFGYYSDGSNHIVGATVVSNNTWYHASLVKNGTDYEFFVNGGSTGTDGGSNPSSGVGLDAIGIRETSGSYQYPFNGLLNDVRIYNRALSTGEVSELHRTTRPGGPGRLAKPRVKYWVMGTMGNWSWLNHLQNSPYGISQ